MLAKRVLLTAAVLWIAAGSASSAPIVADLQPAPGVPDLLRDPSSYTIADITAAGGIIIGDKLFDYFRVVTTKSVNAIAPGAGEIAITPIQVLKAGAPLGGDYGMIFNGPWSAPAGQLSDSTIEFHASILPDFVQRGFAFKDNGLWITAFGVSNNTNGGGVSVSENLYAAHPSQGGGDFERKFVYYNSPADYDLLDEKTFDPITDMWIVKDVVAYGGVGETGMAHISEFYQTFSQVPEPASLGLIALGSLGLLLRRRRRS